VIFASGEPITGSFDPTSHTTLAQINLEGFIFGKLFRTPMRPEDPDEIIWELATGQKIIDENTIEYTLREGVKFHDGKEFSAEDVKATFEYASQPGRPAAWYPGPAEVEVVDRLTARVHTDKGNYPASAYYFLAGFLPIMSAKDTADPESLRQRPNGTGPYKFVEQRGDTTIMQAFADYQEGKPSIENLEFAYIGDVNTRVLALLNGEADIIERLEPEQYETLKSEAKVRLSRTIATENKYLHFRCNKPPFDNEMVRQAACHAVDRSVVLDIMGEAGQASNAHISPVKFGYVDVPDYPEYDLEKSAALLEQAGFPGGNGLPELEYLVSVGFYPKTKEYGEAITAMLQEAGFPVTLNVMETAAWLERIYQRKEGEAPGHLVDVGWSTGSPEPDLVLRPMWHSSASLITGIKDPELDAVLDKEQRETDPEARRKIIQEETLPTLARKAPSLSLFTSVLLHGINANLENVYFYPNGPIDLSKATFTGG
jgi:peptide/nickel transport system substrate-binding protein